jgi:hypothetical protein
MSEIIIHKKNLEFTPGHLDDSDRDTGNTSEFDSKYIVDEDGTKIFFFPRTQFNHSDVFEVFGLDPSDNTERLYGGLMKFYHGHPIANAVAPLGFISDLNGKYFYKAYNNPECVLAFYPKESYKELIITEP